MLFQKQPLRVSPLPTRLGQTQPIADPTSPQKVDSYLTPGTEILGLGMVGKQAHLLGKKMNESPWQYMHTVDVKERGNIRQLGLRELEFKTASGLYRIVASDGCLCIPKGKKGLNILCETSITPTPPSLVYLPMLSQTHSYIPLPGEWSELSAPHRCLRRSGAGLLQVSSRRLNAATYLLNNLGTNPSTKVDVRRRFVEPRPQSPNSFG